MSTSLRSGLLLGIVFIGGQAFAAAPVLQRSDATAVVLGNPVDYHVVATGGATAFSAQGLPAGVVINAGTGEITGQPTEVGTYPIKVTAANSDGSATTTVTLSVVDPAAGPLIYAPLVFDAYRQPQAGGDTFTCALKATGNPTTYAATTALPANWTFSRGTIVGSTTTPGLYLVNVTATNANGIGSAGVTIRVHPACTEAAQTNGTLHAGDTYRVTVTFNRAVTFSGPPPYLEIALGNSGTIRQVPYLSGNGSDTFTFAYTIANDDATGGITLLGAVQPASAGAVDGVTDQDGLSIGSSLPVSSIPSATVSAAPVAAAPSAPSPVATTASASTTANTATAPSATSSTSTSAGAGAATTAGTAVATPPAATPAASSTVATTTASTSTGAGAPTGAATAISGVPESALQTGSANAGTLTTATSSVTPVAAANTSGSAGAAPAAVPADGTATAGSRLVNLSARAAVSDGAAAQAFIAGFVVSGSAPKRVLVRAVGPTLASYGVQNALPNPELRLVDSSGRVVADNAGWSGADVSAASTATGAFALPAGSRDAAVVATLSPGNYSMQVLPNGGTGVALAEVYDADAAGASQPLVNLSTRGFVAGGERVLTAGFVVNGNAPKRVLVRGVGPGLQAYGVTGALADPKLLVYQGSTVVTQNAGWEHGTTTAADLAAAAKAVGAFQLTSGSNDAAAIVTLAPGAYTAVVSSASGGSGAGLVEVYELPATAP